MAPPNKTYRSAIHNKLTQAFLKSILRYNKCTGLLRWKKRIDVPHWINKRDQGKIAGSLTNTGAISIGINGTAYQAHCLIWLMVTGKHPCAEVDHQNGKRADNRWKNLRPATHVQNMRNQKSRANTASGFKGVSFYKRDKKWRARIGVNYKRIWLGDYDTPKQAYAAYCEAAKKLYGEFSRL